MSVPGPIRDVWAVTKDGISVTAPESAGTPAARAIDLGPWVVGYFDPGDANRVGADVVVRMPEGHPVEDDHVVRSVKVDGGHREEAGR